MNVTEIIEGGAVIKVIGVGGGGIDAVNHMVASGLHGINFAVADTDMQFLAAVQNHRACRTIQLGSACLKGSSPGSNPNLGSQAAQESLAEIKGAIGNANIVFVVAGMGGSTATGAAPVIARIAREAGALTVGVAGKPFSREGKKRCQQAEAGIKAFRDSVDGLIVIPNNRADDKSASLSEYFTDADEAMHLAVRAISDLIARPGAIGPDFVDVRSALVNAGSIVVMGFGTASGDGRARAAARAALTCPLLEGVSPSKAHSALLHIAVSAEVTVGEVTEAVEMVQSELDDDALVLWGAHQRENLAADELCLTLFIGGGTICDEPI